MIEIVNVRECLDFGTRPGDVLVDRSTKWGNPFHMGSLTRDQVCDEYEKWIIDQLAEGKLNIDEIIHAKRLGCHCAPLRCHAESLRTLIALAKKDVIL